MGLTRRTFLKGSAAVAALAAAQPILLNAAKQPIHTGELIVAQRPDHSYPTQMVLSFQAETRAGKVGKFNVANLFDDSMPQEVMREIITREAKWHIERNGIVRAWAPQHTSHEVIEIV